METKQAAVKNRRRRRKKRKVPLYLLLLTYGIVILCLVVKHSRPEEAAVPTQTGVSAAPTGVDYDESVYTQISMSQAQRAQGDLALVNASHPFDAAAVTDLQTVYSGKTDNYNVKDVELQVQPHVLSHLNDWLDAFSENTGLRDVNVVAGYRTREEQQALYDNAVATKGAEHARNYLAVPGCSEHHTALAVDFDLYDAAIGTSSDFDGKGQYQWLLQHAWEYGFIQRYAPDKSELTGIAYESWHFRYVGVPHARQMTQLGLCLEEYTDYLRGFPFGGEHLFVSCGDKTYEVYFCAGDTVYVPLHGSYTVSGNNDDGYIVTVG